MNFTAIWPRAMGAEPCQLLPHGEAGLEGHIICAGVLLWLGRAEVAHQPGTGGPETNGDCHSLWQCFSNLNVLGTPCGCP